VRKITRKIFRKGSLIQASQIQLDAQL